MLRDAGVRTKLLAVLAIPTVLLIVVTTLLVGGQFTAARQAGQVNGMTDVAVQVNRVVHSLQEERSATLRYLQDPTSSTQAAMDGQRQFTNQQLRQLDKTVASSPVDQMSAAVQTAVGLSVSGHGGLPSARASIDHQRFFATEADVFYSKTIRVDLDLPGVIASSGTPELAQRLQAYGAISSAIEYAAHERDLVEVGLLRGTLTEADFAQSAALVAQQRQSLQDFQRNAPADGFHRLDDGLAKSEVTEIDQVRRSLPDLLKGKDPDFGGSVIWVGAANSRISPMTAAETGLVADIATAANATQNAQEQRALVLVFGALLGLGLALMLAISLARRITRPLRRLTVAASEIGHELPQMVERMQTPGDGPGVVVEPIPVESSDEIGRLAVAFNTVNDVTVAVAKEQAALRSSIAEMFVNVARRNQVLLGRQLSQLDRMEAREEDPDVLDSLFKLDHLATRMRRNAESLLVLAGIDSTRRLRSVLPLSDVIRTAVGEIESFDRIDLSMAEDPDVSGRHALTVAHLLAELLENATHFSNPDTRVVVSASVTGHGVDVTVTDYGLGMSPEEIADANEKIAHPPVAEIAVSQRLGLFVVGRLASRLGATVELRRGRAAGTVVAVALPSSVFEGFVQQVVEDEVAVAPVFGGAPAEHVDDDAQPADEVDELVFEPAEPARKGLLRRGRRRGPAATEAPSEVAEVEAAEVEVAEVEVAEVHPAAEVEAAEVEAAEADAAVEVTGSDSEAAEAAPETDSTEHAATRPPRKGLFRRGHRQAAAPDPVAAADAEIDAEINAAADAAADRDVEVEPVRSELGTDAREVEPAVEPVAELAPAPQPELVAEPVAEVDPEPVAEVEPVREPELVAEVEPVREPEPLVPIVFAATAAVDVLPSRNARSGGRFGRHRQPPVAPQPAPYVPVVAPPAAAAQVAAAPAPAPAPFAAPAPAPIPERAPVSAPVAEQAPVAPSQQVPAVPVPVTPMPRRAAVPLPASAEPLPERASVGATASASAATASGGSDRSELDRMTARSDLQSSALSELRGLYAPSFTPEVAPPVVAPSGGLTRRTPKSVDDGAAATAAPAQPARTRSAAEVRGMLSGFRAGVERGRGSADSADGTSTDSTDGTSSDPQTS
jgi:signal transduction histidine kinase